MLESEGFKIVSNPIPNFEIKMGENTSVRFCFNEEKTLLKRLKWYLFCLFFPFKIVRWD